ncbi:MAG: hypothetical protein NTW69_07385 [Chloroflexi bacterium]|nr:hypothetical protein [Chloroflexota bacterium]
MKKIIIPISFLILAAVACSLSSRSNLLPVPPTINPVAATAVVMPTLKPVSATKVVTPTLNPTSAALVVTPTQTFQPPTFTSVAPVQPDSSNTIRFDAGGTWMDLLDNINPGASKIYTLNATKGQIMSVSILGANQAGVWGYFPIEIKGSDGKILCPVFKDTECSFWRGKLPLSQDYFIKVTPAGDLTDFILRVAINPPGKSEQLFQYKNPATGLSLTYSDQFGPARFPSSANNKTNSELVLQFIDTNSYVKTNLSEVYFLLGSSADPQIVASCTDVNQSFEPEQLDGNEVINGYTFVHSSSDGAGAGNYYQQEIYRMVNKNVCYEVIYFIHYTNIGNYTPGQVTEFDMNGLLQKFNTILSTFSLK